MTSTTSSLGRTGVAGEVGQQGLADQPRRSERRHVGVAAVVRRPPHVHHENRFVFGTQPVYDGPRERVLMDVASEDEDWYVGARLRQGPVLPAHLELRL